MKEKSLRRTFTFAWWENNFGENAAVTAIRKENMSVAKKSNG